jgi:hypothetical protein
MQGKLAEGKLLSARAWSLKSGKHDITSGRILFMRLAIALLEAQSSEFYLGQLKTLLAGRPLEAAGNVATTWNITSFIESLRSTLSPTNAALLEALASALNNCHDVPNLNEFLQWKGPPTVPLDAPWP